MKSHLDSHFIASLLRGSNVHESWKLMRNTVINKTVVKRNSKKRWCQSITLNTVWERTAFLSSLSRCYRLPKQTCCWLQDKSWKGTRKTYDSIRPYVQRTCHEMWWSVSAWKRTNAQTTNDFTETCKFT